MKRFFFSLALVGITSAFSLAQAKPASHKTKGVQTKSALTFAKSHLTALANGDTSIDKDIDWNKFLFTAPGTTLSVGYLYKQMPNDKERAAFRHSFIASFGQSFRKQGQVAAISRWRVKSENATRAIIAATGQNGDMELGVSKDKGQMKLVSMTIVPKK